MNRRSFLKTTATGAGLAWLAPRMAFAQDYPSRVIRIVASNSAGTPPDILARIAAAALTDGEGAR
jgi:tripartite-type tricarboxylate transporter receptor subunit TctC